MCVCALPMIILCSMPSYTLDPVSALLTGVILDINASTSIGNVHVLHLSFLHVEQCCHSSKAHWQCKIASGDLCKFQEGVHFEDFQYSNYFCTSCYNLVPTEIHVQMYMYMVHVDLYMHFKLINLVITRISVMSQLL